MTLARGLIKRVGAASVVLLVAAALTPSAQLVRGQDCAPAYGVQKSCAAPSSRMTCRPKTRRFSRDEEFERRLAEEVAAAVAEATLQAERERLGAGAGAGAPTEFVAPPASGVVAGATNSFGLRGLEITFPELKFALPSLQLPSLVRLRREAEMHLDSGRATMVRSSEAAGGAASPGMGAFAGGPNGVFIPFPQPTGQPAPASGAPAAPAAAGEAEGGAAPAGMRLRRRKAEREFWEDDEYEVIEEDSPDCAPPPSCAPVMRNSCHPSRTNHEPVQAPGVPPEPEVFGSDLGDVRRVRKELDDARRELQATRQQIEQLSALIADAGLSPRKGKGGAPLGVRQAVTVMSATELQDDDSVEAASDLFATPEARPSERGDENQSLDRLETPNSHQQGHSREAKAPGAVKVAAQEPAARKTWFGIGKGRTPTSASEMPRPGPGHSLFGGR